MAWFSQERGGKTDLCGLWDKGDQLSKNPKFPFLLRPKWDSGSSVLPRNPPLPPSWMFFFLVRGNSPVELMVVVLSQGFQAALCGGAGGVSPFFGPCVVFCSCVWRCCGVSAQFDGGGWNSQMCQSLSFSAVARSIKIPSAQSEHGYPNSQFLKSCGNHSCLSCVNLPT